MKKICFLYSDITGTGGIEKSISVISNNLVMDNYKVNILSITQIKKEPFFYFNKIIKIDKLNNSKSSIIMTIFKLRNYLKKNKIDILIVCNVALDIVALPASILLKTKVISWEHFGFNDNLSNKHIKKARLLATKFSDCIIVLTDYDKNKYIENYKINKKVKLIQIYNPIENSEYNTLINDNKTILTIGHFLPVKGYDFLMKVSQNVLMDNPDWKWIIIGDGKYKEDFIKKISDSKISKQIIIKSNIRNIEDYYKRAEIYVNTSRSEGFPLTVLEAKSYNLPIIGFEIPALKKLVINDVNGNLIKKYDINNMIDTINNLIKNVDIRKKYSEKAKNNISEYFLPNIMKRWKEIIDEL